MKMKTRRREKLLTNTKKQFQKKQNTFLQFGTFIHYRNERVELYHENDILIKRKINNIQIKDYELNKTKL